MYYISVPAYCDFISACYNIKLALWTHLPTSGRFLPKITIWFTAVD